MLSNIKAKLMQQATTIVLLFAITFMLGAKVYADTCVAASTFLGCGTYVCASNATKRFYVWVGCIWW